MSIAETVLIYGVIPLAITAVIAGLSFTARVPKQARYKLGEKWTREPIWWAAIDEQTHGGHGGHAAIESGHSVIGGVASGKW
ncbi:hypothetical protein [Speluncibacter jeojiensis]|uniref:Uncharacterized protein n=1 Tax=Speluncibacter jeojiensis TaxID=2710754 RepID=A0A9X4M152_9ACTN|nr:hypothetical protein [Corynebacteriales bacterium D3-21]